MSIIAVLLEFNSSYLLFKKKISASSANILTFNMQFGVSVYRNLTDSIKKGSPVTHSKVWPKPDTMLPLGYVTGPKRIVRRAPEPHSDRQGPSAVAASRP